MKGIKTHGIRNAAQTTVAPTGTIATVAGCEGYGCEPVFALAYIRHVNDHGKDLQLTYASPRFDEALKKLGLGEEKRQEIVETGDERRHLPAHQRDPPGGDEMSSSFLPISPPKNTSACRLPCRLLWITRSPRPSIFRRLPREEDVARAYMLAWELGCKGITVYVTGSREKVVLETKATAEKKEPLPASAAREIKAEIRFVCTGCLLGRWQKATPAFLARRDL